MEKKIIAINYADPDYMQYLYESAEKYCCNANTTLDYWHGCNNKKQYDKALEYFFNKDNIQKYLITSIVGLKIIDSAVFLSIPTEHDLEYNVELAIKLVKNIKEFTQEEFDKIKSDSFYCEYLIFECIDGQLTFYIK